jgi:hypothetical protein
MAQRAKSTITEIEGSHVIMISQPQAVTDVILSALLPSAPQKVGRRQMVQAGTECGSGVKASLTSVGTA